MSRVIPYYEYLTGEDWSRFYTGLISGKSESIAKWLLEDSRINWLIHPHSIKTFNRVEREGAELFNIRRAGAFFDVKHISKKPSDARYEQWLEKLIVRERLRLDTVGDIVTCEVPFNSMQGGQNKGRIDLVSVSPDHSTIYLLELKKWASHEPLVRCLIEVYTYFRSISKESLSRFCEEFVGSKSAKIVLCPMIFDDSLAANELNEKGASYAAVEKIIDENMEHMIGGGCSHIAYQVICRNDPVISRLVSEAIVKAEVAANRREAADVLAYQDKLPVCDGV